MTQTHSNTTFKINQVSEEGGTPHGALVQQTRWSEEAEAAI